MDIVLKKVSVNSLILIKLSIESMIHNLEREISNMEKDFKSASKFSKTFFLDMLKEKKDDLARLRNIFNQL